MIWISVFWYRLVSSKLTKMLGFKGYLPRPLTPTPRSKPELALLSRERAKLRGRSKTENWDSPLICHPLCVMNLTSDFLPALQRIRSTVDEKEQKQLLMDLDVVMRSSDCPYIVQFYGALFREVTQTHALLGVRMTVFVFANTTVFVCVFRATAGYVWS